MHEHWNKEPDHIAKSVVDPEISKKLSFKHNDEYPREIHLPDYVNLNYAMQRVDELASHDQLRGQDAEDYSNLVMLIEFAALKEALRKIPESAWIRGVDEKCALVIEDSGVAYMDNVENYRRTSSPSQYFKGPIVSQDTYRTTILRDGNSYEIDHRCINESVGLRKDPRNRVGYDHKLVNFQGEHISIDTEANFATWTQSVNAVGLPMSKPYLLSLRSIMGEE